MRNAVSTCILLSLTSCALEHDEIEGELAAANVGKLYPDLDTRCATRLTTANYCSGETSAENRQRLDNLITCAGRSTIGTSVNAIKEAWPLRLDTNRTAVQTRQAIYNQLEYLQTEVTSPQFLTRVQAERERIGFPRPANVYFRGIKVKWMGADPEIAFYACGEQEGARITYEIHYDAY